MSEKFNYLTLSYKTNQQDINIPSSFRELNEEFFQKFNEDDSKNFIFSYLNDLKDEDDCIINEDNFSEEIEKIKKEEKVIFVNEVKNENESMKQSVNISKQFANPKEDARENNLKRQNCMKELDSINEEILINNNSNLEKSFDYKNINIINIDLAKSEYGNKNYMSNQLSDSNVSNNEEIYLMKVKSNQVLKESENDSIILKDKEKEIEDLKKTINELKDAENKNISINKDLSKALEEEKNKNKDNINKLVNQLKEIKEKLEKEQNEKNELIELNQDLKSKNNTLENKLNESQLLINSNQNKNTIAMNQLKSNNNKLKDDIINKEKELEEKQKELIEIKEKYKQLESKQNESEINIKMKNKLEKENKQLKKELEKINLNREEEIKKENRIKDLEEQIKNLKDIEDKLNNNKTCINMIGGDNENNTIYNGTMSGIFNTTMLGADKYYNEEIKMKQIEKNKKKLNKLEMINKRKNKAKTKDSSNSNINKINIEKAEKYKEKFINFNKTQIMKKSQLIGKNEIIEKKEIDAHENNNADNKELLLKKNEEIKEFQKKVKDKETELKNAKDLIKQLENKIKSNESEIELKEKDDKLQFEKEKEEYQIKIKDFEIQLDNQKQILNEAQKKLEYSEKEKNDYLSKIKISEQNLQKYIVELNQQNININQLKQEIQKKENEKKELFNKIESYKSDLTKSQQLSINKNMEQKKELETKMKEYQIALEQKYKKLYEEGMKISTDKIYKNLLEKQNSIQKNFEMVYKNMENNCNQKLNNMSNLILQSQINANKCKTIHQGIKCNICLKNPIVGYRYKCLICDNYSLCEECEERNSVKEFHPHSFIKMRKYEPENKINIINPNNFNNNMNNNNNNNDNKFLNLNSINNRNNDDDFQIMKFGDDDPYSFECINKENLIAIIQEETEDLEMEIIVKNNGKSKWPENKAKLVFNEQKNLVGQDIVLDPQNPGSEEKYKIYFKDLKSYPASDYQAGLFFEVDGKKYGEDIDIKIKITEKKGEEHKQIIEEFREEFSLSKDEYSDEKILEVLKKNNFDKGEAFSSLFT